MIRKQTFDRLYVIAPEHALSPTVVSQKVWKRLQCPFLKCRGLVEHQTKVLLERITLAVKESILSGNQDKRPLSFSVMGLMLPPQRSYILNIGVIEIDGKDWTIIFDPFDDFEHLGKKRNGLMMIVCFPFTHLSVDRSAHLMH